MTTIAASYCRITGNARNLPRPCYFPLLPPISPADAKKICRITGRATDLHHYSPLIAFGKPYRFDGVEGCRITQHENLCFTRPIFIKIKDNESSIECLNQLLDKMKNKRIKSVDDSKLFVYKLTDQSTAIVLPPELEEAIRTGEIENMSISKDVAYMNLKIKEGRLVKIQMQSVEKTEIDLEKIHYGEGQNSEVLEKQQKVLNERNKRKQETMARKKMFEQKEQKAEEEERKATERPKSDKPLLKFDPVKRKEKLAKLGKLIQDHQENTSIILPKYDPVSKVNPDEQVRYEKMLEDIAKAQKVSVNVMTVLSTNFNWSEIESAESGFDWDSYPREEMYDPVEVEVINVSSNDIALAIKNIKTIDIAASVETIEPAPIMDDKVLKAIKDIKRENLAATENVADSIKSMDAKNMLPNMKDIRKIIEEQKNLVQGYLVNVDSKPKFVEKENYRLGEETALAGALLLVEDEEKFISGQIVHLAEEETFVAGQTFEDSSGNKQFVPGQTLTDEDGEICFIPGHLVAAEEGNTFIAGHIVDENNKLQFVSGQMVDRGDKKPVFVSGQTLLTDNGLKFVPGEFITDKLGYKIFIPGMVMTSEEGGLFVPGQVFQSGEGINFTPGQVIDTEEGPSFIMGKSCKTSDGENRFIKGEISEMEDGQITFIIEKSEIIIPEIKEELIPNEDLQLVAVIGKDISGFVVKPTNTSNIQAAERLYGDLVENDSSILFYLSGKLPNDISSEAKVISGKLIVDETSQRFIPGKLMQSEDGESFVPGQLVKTNNGEEFIPGQFVETANGPKFVPGHTVMTSVGEKFIPGQVIMEEDGPRFVPGQIIQTKNGATFIPGQMMNTDKGKKFVPGQLVETKDGPRFVPGQVIVTNEGPKFVSGTVVETEEGLKYLPTTTYIDVEETEDDSEISFQGFDISPEEIQLLSHTIKNNAKPHSPITKEIGLIDSSTLKKLAADTMDIHGRTPEPNVDKKKKKKKKGKITIDALDDDEEKVEDQKEDAGTNKVEILKQLLKAGLTVSSFRKEKEIEKLNQLLGNLENYNEREAEIEAMKFINSQTPHEDLCEQYIGNDEQLIEDILFEIGGDADNLKRNDEVTKIVNDAIRKCVTKKCDEQISDLIRKIIKDPDSLFTDSFAQILLTEAVGIVCVTGDVEVASLLEKFISEPNDPNCLKDDPDVLAVLRQLLVLNRIAERNPEVAKVLQELQDDPEGVKDRNKIRKFIRDAKALLVSEKKIDRSFDVRHVTSSKDIPTEIFEQIRQDKKEAEKFMEKLPDELWKAIMGDERCGGRFIESLESDKSGKAKREMDRFRRGMAVVVAKESVQAVIPRHYARSIYYGIMPYLLIDEEGFKFFERGLTGRKLAPSRVIENTWYQPDSYYEKSVLAQQVTPSGMQYNLIFLGNSYQREIPAYQYTSLLPSSGPTKISYLENQRRASRDGSITPHRRSSRSTTPSRRISLSGLNDYIPSTTNSYSYTGKYSNPLTSSNLARGVSPIESYNVNTYSPYSSDTSSYDMSRSGTVGKLLDKYSRVSLAKELGYSKPSLTSSRYKSYDDEVNGEDDANDSGYSLEDRKYLPTSTGGRQSSFTPELSDESSIKPSQDKDYSSYSAMNKKTLLRPFSDIYESEELDSPTSDRSSLRSSLIETARKNYEALNSDYDFKTPTKKNYDSLDSDYDYSSTSRKKYDAPISDYDSRATASTSPKESYSSKLKNWKNKLNDTDDDELEEEKPLKISHNRYESVLTGEDDYNPGKYKYKTRIPSYDNKKLDDNDIDDDDISGEKYRLQMRQKYSRGIRDLNKSLNPAKTSIFTKPTKADVKDEEDISSGKMPDFSSGKMPDFSSGKRPDISSGKMPDISSGKMPDISSGKMSKYSSLKDDSEFSKKYLGKDEINGEHKGKDVLDEPSNMYSNSYTGGYNSPYDYGMGQSYYGQSMGYEQPQSYATPSMGMYGYQPGYRGHGEGGRLGTGGGVGNGVPMHGYGGGGTGGGVPMYGYGGGGVPMHGYGGGGGGMNTYSQHPPYMGGSVPRYGPGLGMTGGSPYSSYGSGAPLGVRNQPYGGVPRRYTMPIHLTSDDDDDDGDGDTSSYKPKVGTRKLASQIAKKYIGDSDGEEN